MYESVNANVCMNIIENVYVDKYRKTQVCERRAESGEWRFGERRAKFYSINLDRKWVYYRGFRGY